MSERKSRQPTFHLRRSKAGWWTTVVGGNGQPMWTSETHPTRRSAMQAVNALVRWGCHFELVDHTHPIPAPPKAVPGPKRPKLATMRRA